MLLDASSGIDNEKLYELKNSMGIITEIPLLGEAATSVAMVLLACGDANGFIADQLTDVVADINAFAEAFKKEPAAIMLQLNSDKKFVERQIRILQESLK